MGAGKTISRIQKAGYTVSWKSKHHVQITGGMKPVNYYPYANRPSVYVNGQQEGYKFPGGSDHAAISIRILSEGQFPSDVETVSRPGGDRKRRIKAKLYRKSPLCHWCRKKFELAEMTLDHLIPVSQGGSNRNDNFVLACDPCNKQRKNIALPLKSIQQKSFTPPQPVEQAMP